MLVRGGNGDVARDVEEKNIGCLNVIITDFDSFWFELLNWGFSILIYTQCSRLENALFDRFIFAVMHLCD